MFSPQHRTDTTTAAPSPVRQCGTLKAFWHSHGKFLNGSPLRGPDQCDSSEKTQ